MSYHTWKMDDAVDHYRTPWARGTLRVFHTDERKCWSITTLHDLNYGNAANGWHATGEFYDGEKWIPIAGNRQAIYDWLHARGGPFSGNPFPYAPRPRT